MPKAVTHMAILVCSKVFLIPWSGMINVYPNYVNN